MCYVVGDPREILGISYYVAKVSKTKSHRSVTHLQEQLVIYFDTFPIRFVCGKLAQKITNGDHVNVG